MLLRTAILYAHTGIELLAGGLLFVRGQASVDEGSDQGGVGRLYRRWHGGGLLALACLGYLGATTESVAVPACQVCGFFHLLAGLAGFLALLDEDPRWTSAKAILNPHNLLTIGFAYVLQRG
eukprot:TRINITY_DN11940_c0_g1_i1.p1 TRINITY_DN11940_c0_g1~~TRINITY_DN11940_c0_g1_i1.p1  ORF type:complete len:122 (-),score=6.91 TRINITY_DN11940_c0_g1_i1:99-464(-)